MIITRDEQPVAKLVAQKPPDRKPRQPGTLKGILVVHAEDAEHLEDFKDWDTTRSKGLERFTKSELVHLLSRKRSKPAAQDLKPRDLKPRDENSQEMIVDLRLGGIDRTFLVRMTKQQSRLILLIGGSRAQRFAGLVDEFRKTFDSFRIEQ